MLLFALNNWRILLMGTIVLALGTSTAYYRWQANRWEAKYEAYVAEVAAVAAAAAERTKATEAKNKKEKELADAKNAARLADLRVANQRLRDERNNSGYLPSPASSASDPDRISFSRAKLESAIRRLDEGLSEIAGQCDDERSKLNVLREWYSGIMSGQ